MTARMTCLDPIKFHWFRTSGRALISAAKLGSAPPTLRIAIRRRSRAVTGSTVGRLHARRAVFAFPLRRWKKSRSAWRAPIGGGHQNHSKTLFSSRRLEALNFCWPRRARVAECASRHLRRRGATNRRVQSTAAVFCRRSSGQYAKLESSAPVRVPGAALKRWRVYVFCDL
jgi:hypothetical protein